MSDSARHQLYHVLETVYGTTPTTPALTTLRHISNSLAIAKAGVMSEELRSDRQVADFRHGVRQCAGEIGGELSYGSYDAMLEAALLGTWAAKFTPTIGTDISAASGDNSINSAGAAFPAYEPGDRISIAGFTGTVGNNQSFLKVVSRTASKIVVSGGVALVTDAAGESVTVTSLTQVLKAGTTRRSFSFQRTYSDQSDADGSRHVFKGSEITKLSVGFTAGDDPKVTVGLGVIGKDLAILVAEITGATYPAVTTTKMMDCLRGAILEGGAAIGVITETQLTLENGLQPRFVVASDSTILPSIGRSVLNGTSTAFFENKTLLEKFLNETASSIAFRLEDLVGNAYTFKIPNVTYTGGQADVSGQGAITIPLPWQAIYDPTSATQITIERHPAA